MNYETAKKLKEAGFPKKHFYIGDKTTPYLQYTRPTIYELISACGDEFVGVRNFKAELIRTHGKEKGLKYFNGGYDTTKEWIADSTRQTESDEGTIGWISEGGSTPEEAVAALWLALNNH